MKAEKTNERTIKPYESLTFADNFMFCEILKGDPELCKEVVETILDVRIKEIVKLDDEESVKTSFDGKGIRLDVYMEDDDAIYDIELQVRDERNLPMRSRYYQGGLDTDFLKTGEDYNELKKSYIIFICMFDLFKKGLVKYTFSNRCHEDLQLSLKDEAYKVFVNSQGILKDASPKMQEFLQYLNDGSVNGSLSRKIDADLREALRDDGRRSKYMTFEWELARVAREAKEEGIAEGLKQGHNEGRKEGLSEGRKEGRKEGLSEGRKEGRTEGLRESIQLLLEKLSPAEVVALGFSEEDVAKAAEL